MPLPQRFEFTTLGFQVVDWYEHFLCHGPGDVEAEELHLDDELAAFICWLYRLHPEGEPQAGRRLAHRAILSRPKGRAKSELAGAVVCGEGLGPVRFDRWATGGEVSDWGYEFEPGEPIGKPVRSPFIRCLATEEGQAGNTYDNVYTMLSQGRAAEHYGLREGREVGLTRTFLPEGGEIRPSTAGDASKEGGLETFSVADETHLYVAPSLRGMYRTVARNTGKRKEAEPLMLDTTTAFRPGERSIAEQAAERYADREPEETLLKTGVLYDHRQGDEPKRFKDDRSLTKAMRSGYGPAAERMDFKRICRIVRDAEDPEEEAYRYWLNRPRAAASHWLLPDEIDQVLEPESEVKRGTPIGLGFDGSETDDHTALWASTREGLLFPIGIWTPGAEEDQTAWHAEVDEAVEWTFENFRVVRFYADPAWWQEELARWRSRHGDVVAEFWTGGRSEAKFAIACGALRTVIRQRTAAIDPVPLRTEPQLRDGKPIAVWHFENARTRRVRTDDEAEGAYTVRKARKGSPLKIDSVPAAALARRARDDAEKLGLFEEPETGRAAWQGEGAGPRRVARSAYLPCRNCGKPIHPDLHSGPEKGLCLRCRTSDH